MSTQNYGTNANSIPWNDAIKKEARGTDDCDLGEVQDVGSSWVHTQRGTASKTQFYIPKYLVRGYDGHEVVFNVTDAQSGQFQRDTPPMQSDVSGWSSRYRTRETPANIEQRIPLISEQLNVQKTQTQREAVIRKEPVAETKTMEVPVTHEELRVERRPASGTTQMPRKGPVQRETEIRVPLKSEDVQVSKTPVVREEVVVKKTPVTETRRVTEQVRSERIKGTTTSATEDEEEEEEEMEAER